MGCSRQRTVPLADGGRTERLEEPLLVEQAVDFRQVGGQAQAALRQDRKPLPRVSCGFIVLRTVAPNSLAQREVGAKTNGTRTGVLKLNGGRLIHNPGSLLDRDGSVAIGRRQVNK